VPGGLSVKLISVLAATAFVGAFRVGVGVDDEPATTGSTLSPAGANAMAADTSAQPAVKGVAAPALSRVAALPALHRAPARKRVAGGGSTRAATPAATPTATVAPIVTAAPPARAKAKPYVGKSFDSKG
jgi:hypothetical protein